MKKITVSQIMKWGPCDRYPKERVRELIGRGKTLLEILYLYIPVRDRLWVYGQSTGDNNYDDKLYDQFVRCEISLGQFRIKQLALCRKLLKEKAS